MSLRLGSWSLVASALNALAVLEMVQVKDWIVSRLTVLPAPSTLRPVVLDEPFVETGAVRPVLTKVVKIAAGETAELRMIEARFRVVMTRQRAVKRVVCRVVRGLGDGIQDVMMVMSDRRVVIVPVDRASRVGLRLTSVGQRAR